MTNHTGHGHLATPAARAACRKFMVEHDGMDEVTYRVSVREAELDDAFEVCDHCGTEDGHVKGCPNMPMPATMRARKVASDTRRRNNV